MPHFSAESLRRTFPALLETQQHRPFIYFDGPGGTQMAQQAVDRMVEYIKGGMANLHGAFPTSVKTDRLLEEGREAVADFLNCAPAEVAFGQNMTSLAFSLARSLGSFISSEHSLVVTELDHRANVDPWVTLAQDKGAQVRYIPVNPETLTLEVDELDQIITENTKLVAVGLSSNVTGTVTDVAKIIKKAKEVNALVVVDAVHAVPHLSIDFANLGCDILLCSAYKFFGPHIGIAVIAASLFEKLKVYKLAPAPQNIPDKLETGTQNHEGIAGLLGAISFIESLGIGQTRRERLTEGMARIAAHEDALAQRLEVFYRAPQRYGCIGHPSTQKTPTFAFTISGVNAREVTSWFAQHYHMCVADGHFYASTLAEKLQVMPRGGWVRIGLAPYNTLEGVMLFERALREFISQKLK